MDKLLPYTHIFRVEDLVEVIDSLTILQVYSSAMVANWMRIGAEENSNLPEAKPRRARVIAVLSYTDRFELPTF